ncbi:uncharacterized protein LOC131859824 [Cryptomeria japonica]|uniref:uncharacterized protein LOC131859824 n=1 Tax=Cryptomeria japonica TaxID=3369 RepID=UPI0027DA958A|nr:uncharacterized protein LOC131859824 [Cryptomeria japonica]
MAQAEGASLTRAPLFDGTDYVFWKVMMEAFINSLDVHMWEVVVTKYTMPKTIPIDPDDKTTYELDKRAKFSILCGLTKDVFVKVMYCNSASDIWVKLETIYQGDEKVKESKLITLKTQFDNLKMNEDENIAAYFLRIDEVVNARKGLGEDIKEHDVVSKVLRTILPKFEMKIFALEEKKHFSNMTLHKLQGILTTYEMRISNNVASTSKETAFKAEKKDDSDSDILDALEELLYGHFAAKSPYADQNEDDEKLENFSKKKPWNENKRFKNFKKKSLLSKEDTDEESDDLVEEGETLFMAEIVNDHKAETIQSESSFDLDEEINFEEELLCSLQEIKRLKKLVSTQEENCQILQVELNTANQTIESQKVLLDENEQKIIQLYKQIEQFEKNEISKQYLNWSANFGFFKGYCFCCNSFGPKANNCKLAIKGPMFGHRQSYGFKRITRCFKCFHYGNFENQCKLKLKPQRVWKPKNMNIEKYLIVETALFSYKPATWVLDSGCSHNMTGSKNKFQTLEDFDGGFVRFGDNSRAYITG